jgi:hypothetical protein
VTSSVIARGCPRREPERVAEQDLIDGVRKALTAVDPTPFFAKYGNNAWAAVKTYQDAQVDYAAAPVIKKYTGILAAADVYTASTAFILLESIRLDLGNGSQIHP